MKNKTDFYAMIHIYKDEHGDKIIAALWEARKLAQYSIPVNRNLIEQINGAIRIRIHEIAPGLKAGKP